MRSSDKNAVPIVGRGHKKRKRGRPRKVSDDPFEEYLREFWRSQKVVIGD